jgi:adenylate cyclase
MSFDEGDLRVETTTIMFADVVESVRLIEEDELLNVSRIRASLKHIAERTLSQHGGYLLERRGDGLLAKFTDAKAAAACALAIHRFAESTASAARSLPAISFRIGLHTDSVLTDDHSLYGIGINLAARIASFADTGGTAISAQTYSDLTPNLDGRFEDAGDCYLKNVEQPVRLFRLLPFAGMNTSRLPDDAQQRVRLKPSVLVLPFVAVGEDVETAKVSAVLTDDVVSGLAKLRGINVLSRLTTHAFSERQTNNESALEVTGADYFVSGSVVYFQGRMVVRYKLSNAKSNHVVGSGQQTDDLASLLMGCSEITAAICTSVGADIALQEVERSDTHPLPTLQSHCAMLSAVSLMHRAARDSYAKSERLLGVLVERHARHPLPHAWTAKQHMLKTMHGWAGDVSIDGGLARQAAERSIRTGSVSSLALAVRGIVASHIERDYVSAARFYDEALEVDENESLAWIFKSTLHSFTGNGADAVFSAERALALSPCDPLRYYFTSLAASAYLTHRQYDQAVRFASESLQLNVRHMSTHRVLVIALVLLGQQDLAYVAGQKLLTIDPAFTVEQFIKKHPGGQSETGRLFADALLSAGLPKS